MRTWSHRRVRCRNKSVPLAFGFGVDLAQRGNADCPSTINIFGIQQYQFHISSNHNFAFYVKDFGDDCVIEMVKYIDPVFVCIAGNGTGISPSQLHFSCLCSQRAYTLTCPDPSTGMKLVKSGWTVVLLHQYCSCNNDQSNDVLSNTKQGEQVSLFQFQQVTEICFRYFDLILAKLPTCIDQCQQLGLVGGPLKPSFQKNHVQTHCLVTACFTATSAPWSASDIAPWQLGIIVSVVLSDGRLRIQFLDVSGIVVKYQLSQYRIEIPDAGDVISNSF